MGAPAPAAAAWRGGAGSAGVGASVGIGAPSVIQQTDADEPHVVALKEVVKAADANGLLSLLQSPPGFPPFPPFF